MTDEYLIDKLVDGELDEKQRRQLLSALDAQRDGWKTCALAFLEAQAWRRGMNSALQTGEVAMAPRRTLSAGSRMPAVIPGKRPHRFAVLYWPSLAAAVIIAFMAGIASQRFLPPNLADGDPYVAPGPGANQTDLGLHYVTDTDTTNAQPARSRKTVLQFPPPDSAETLSGPDGEYVSALREQMLRMLELSGSRIRREHSVFPIHLRDGRHAILPVEDVYVTPVGGVTY